MPIGVSEDHVELQRTIAKFAEEQLRGRARDALDLDAEPSDSVLGELAAMGLLGINVTEELGGEGAGLLDVALVLEELGRVLAPGGYLTSSIALAWLGRGASEATAKSLIPPLLAGTSTASVAMLGAVIETLSARWTDEGELEMDGQLPALLNASAELLVLPATIDGSIRLVVLETSLPGVEISEAPSLDKARRVSALRVDHVRVPAEMLLDGIDIGLARAIAVTLAAAEITGGARACLEIARDHAKDRVQFGRPIGQFQAVKHRLADLLVSVEQMTAATWDAAIALDHVKDDDAASIEVAALCAEVAAALTLGGGVSAAKDAIQILGGMGFTWEHDAHLYLRRAATLRGLLGPLAAARSAVASAAVAGTRRQLGIDLPAEALEHRAQLEPLIAEIAEAPAGEHAVRLGEAGLLFPHWPRPYGRAAGAVEQLVIDELLTDYGVRRPPAHVTAWALPTLIAHGTAEQQERFVMPSLQGKIVWCQLFSEPGAGSDLASLSTKATKVDGGWQIDGQKVWTSAARWATYGILLARSDATAGKHHGITYFILDMAADGVDIRPLREITGEALFNEVFLDQVFIPDDCVVGAVNDGWRLARTTLANERVALASSSAFGDSLEAVLELVGQQGADAVSLEVIGRLLVDAQSLSLMRQRSVLRSVFGLEPGPEASLAKLLGAEQDQRTADLGLELLGAAGVAAQEGPAASFARQMLHTLCLTIAGGTSEVQRNVIGERLLGLPRDPEPHAGP